jgi:hypothetical protein
MVARKKNITNGTPFKERPGLLKASTPAGIVTSVNATPNSIAATSIPRVHGDTGRTVVSAVRTK